MPTLKKQYENLHQDASGRSIILSYNTQVADFPSHWHNYVEAMYLIEGELTVEVSGEFYSLSSQEILFIWPGELHSICPNRRPLTAILQFDVHLLTQVHSLNQCYELLPRLRRVTQAENPDIFALLSAEIMNIHQCRLQEKEDTFPSSFSFPDARMHMHLYQFLIHVHDYVIRMFTVNQSGRTNSSSVMQRIISACSYISSNCTNDLSLEMVAEHVQLSKYHFSRQFQEYTGSSFHHYLAECRINYAKKLLANPGIKITDVALQSGFGSIASFNRIFHQSVGCSPSVFRKLLEKGNSFIPTSR